MIPMMARESSTRLVGGTPDPFKGLKTAETPGLAISQQQTLKAEAEQRYIQNTQYAATESQKNIKKLTETMISSTPVPIDKNAPQQNINVSSGGGKQPSPHDPFHDPWDTSMALGLYILPG